MLTNDSIVSTSTELEPLCKGRDVFSLGLRIHGRGADHEPCGSRRGRALDVLFGHVNGSPACALEPVGIASGCGPGRPAHVDGKGACVVRLGKADQVGEREEITLEAKSTPTASASPGRDPSPTVRGAYGPSRAHRSSPAASPESPGGDRATEARRSPEGCAGSSPPRNSSTPADRCLKATGRWPRNPASPRDTEPNFTRRSSSPSQARVTQAGCLRSRC